MSDPQQRVTCPTCSKGYRWQASLVGKRVPCKQCETVFLVPDAPGVGLAINSIGEDGTYDLDLDAQKDTPASAEFHAVPANNGKCPSCNSPVREGAMLCLNCGFNMAEGKKIEAPTVEALPEEDKKEMRRELKGMKWVRVGLWLNLASVLLMFLLVLFPVAIILWGFESVIMIDIILFGSLALSMLGSLLCLTAPKASGGRLVLFLSIALTFISVAGKIANEFVIHSASLYWTLDVVRMTGTALFLYFFIMLARYLNFSEITNRADKVFGLYIVIALSAYLAIIPIIGCFMFILLFTLSIYMLFLYIALLIDLNNALTFHIRDQSV